MRKRLLLLLCLAACGRLENVGKAPDMTPIEGTYQHHALYATSLPTDTAMRSATSSSSLWTANREALFGERRAQRRGDILTVVIEIDDGAEISNSTDRGRAATDTMSVPSLFGLPQSLDKRLPTGASMAEAVNTASNSSYSGSGSVSRNEKLTLRVAATVVDQLPNGVLRVEGQQEVRVNNELRELIVSGYIRPTDISRRNEIQYDKIAGARISYGGRGQITDVQQPRYGQQIADIILPF